MLFEVVIPEPRSADPAETDEKLREMLDLFDMFVTDENNQKYLRRWNFGELEKRLAHPLMREH